MVRKCIVIEIKNISIANPPYQNHLSFPVWISIGIIPALIDIEIVNFMATDTLYFVYVSCLSKLEVDLIIAVKIALFITNMIENYQLIIKIMTYIPSESWD